MKPWREIAVPHADVLKGTFQLANQLYTLCERKGWAEDARAYNEVVTGWAGTETEAARLSTPRKQGDLFNT